MENQTEGDRSNIIIPEIATTQSVLKNKFEKALANRIENEYNTSETFETLNKDDSLRNIPKIKTIAKNNFADTSIIHNSIDDPNKLCDRLRFILNAQFVCDVNYSEEINTIFKKLRELDLIV